MMFDTYNIIYQYYRTLTIAREVNSMHYLNARFTVLVAAMTFSITSLGQAAWASGDKPAARSMMGTNSILPLSGTSLSTNSVTLVRYTKTYLAAYAEILPSPTCTEVSPGAWTVTADPKYGKVTFRMLTGKFGDGECPGTTFTFAAIYYKWKAHNNKTITNMISDTFNATWQALDSTLPLTFNIEVPEVRPARETTLFVDWWPADQTIGRWRQTLHPPADDPTFDFSGESVQESDAPGMHSDTCWFLGPAFMKADRITGGKPGGWTVKAGNVWEFDSVGWLVRPQESDAVDYYRAPQFGEPARAPCGNRFPQLMLIKAPPDDSYHPYAGVNELGGQIGKTKITSIRAGSQMTRTWVD